MPGSSVGSHDPLEYTILIKVDQKSVSLCLLRRLTRGISLECIECFTSGWHGRCSVWVTSPKRRQVLSQCLLSLNLSSIMDRLGPPSRTLWIPDSEEVLHCPSNIQGMKELFLLVLRISNEWREKDLLTSMERSCHFWEKGQGLTSELFCPLVS